MFMATPAWSEVAVSLSWKREESRERTGFGSDTMQGVQPFASLCHIGRRVVLGHTLNTLRHVITKTSHNLLSKFTILCWAAFTAILSCVQSMGRRLDTPV